ncbi:hypothetical protein BUALT_Bualt01G0137600 [Buddleja alternifolia]|uniref:Zinc finger GRF-type domain-containing protein n=1 Tax=Buddleja alternifolia TaxID=168488 RepID=A0AAV6Y997_9LAMI|nr:hypothetical protein BUALT_Bualt01G0137600 [Buddleja alternifolia]
MTTGGSSLRNSNYSCQHSKPFVEAFVGGTCGCKKQLQIRTSWTKKNPGRKLVGCPNYNKPNACKAFDWIEPEVCDKEMEIGVTLLTRLEEKDDKIKLVEAINQELKSNNEKLHHVTYNLSRTNNALLHKMQEMETQLKTLQNGQNVCNAISRMVIIMWILTIVVLICNMTRK